MDLNIPEWCRHDARLFVLILRQALENPHVSSNLHNWINLIYGYQQQGQAATDAVNKFHPAVSSYCIRIYVIVSLTSSHSIISLHEQMCLEILNCCIVGWHVTCPIARPQKYLLLWRCQFSWKDFALHSVCVLCVDILWIRSE